MYGGGDALGHRTARRRGDDDRWRYPTGGGRVPRTCVIRTKRTIRVPLVDPAAAGIRRAVGIVVTLALVVALSACVPERGESTPDVLQAAWSVKPPAEWGGVEAGRVVNGGVVVRTKRGVGVIDRGDGVIDRGDGAVEWYRPAPESGGGRGWDQVFVTSDQAGSIVTAANSTSVSAFDATDGSTLFTRESSDVAMTVSGPVVVECSAAERRCAVEGLAPRTGEVRWRRDLDGARAWVAGVVDVASRVDMVDGSGLDVTMPFEVPDTENVTVATTMDVGNGAGGTGGATRVVNATNGAILAELSLLAGRVARLVTDRLLLAWDSGQAGCALAVDAVDAVTGTARWVATVGGWRPPPASEGTSSCRDGWGPATANGRLLAMTADERPVLLDLETGGRVWIGTAGSHLFGVAGNVAVSHVCHKVGEGGRTCELAGVDIVSGTTMWRYPADGRWGDRVAITGTRFAFYIHTSQGREDYAELIVIDTSSGKTRKAAGYNSLLSAGPNWLLTDGGPTPRSEGEPQTLRLFIS